VDGDVLAALARADASFTGRGLHRVIGRYSADGVRKSLERLVEQGIVDVEDVGRAKTYRLNRQHLAADHLIKLARLFETFVEKLRTRLVAWNPSPDYAALFGSAARSDMRPDSDIDLFVVRPEGVDGDDPRWATRLRTLSSDATRWIGNDVRVLEMSAVEVRAGLRTRSRVLASIRQEGIRLMGPADYLHRPVATRRPIRG
jgi:predicted nucleotidyltransferase